MAVLPECEELQGEHAVGIDPATAGRGDDGQDLAVETAGPLQVARRQLGPLLGRVGGLEPDVGPDRLHHFGFGPVEGLELRLGRGLGHEGPSVLAQRVPRDERLWTAGGRRRRGLLDARGGRLVEGAPPLVQPVDEAVEDDVARDDDRQDDENRGGDAMGERTWDVATEEIVQPAQAVPDQAGEEEEDGPDHDGHEDHGHERHRGDVRHAEEVALVVLPDHPERQAHGDGDRPRLRPARSTPTTGTWRWAGASYA